MPYYGYLFSGCVVQLTKEGVRACYESKISMACNHNNTATVQVPFKQQQLDYVIYDMMRTRWTPIYELDESAPMTLVARKQRIGTDLQKEKKLLKEGLDYLHCPIDISSPYGYAKA